MREHDRIKIVLKDDNGIWRKRAFQSLLDSLDLSKTLPNKVFHGRWNCFLFCESDRIFAPEFPEVISDLLDAEGAQGACLINLDETKSLKFENISAIFLNKTVTGADYSMALDGDDSGNGWRYQMQRYACTSDVGEWCMYCEKMSDIAVIAIRSEFGGAKLKAPLEKLWAWPLPELVEGGSKSVFPFTHLTAEWRRGLSKNY